MKLLRSIGFATGLVALFAGVQPVFAQSFRELVPYVVPPGAFPDVVGVSAQGAVIAGTRYLYLAGDPSFGEAFRWTEAGGGSVDLGNPPNAITSGAAGISRLGDVIVGTGYLRNTADPRALIPQVFRWTEAGGSVDLGIHGYASAVSADGIVLVGNYFIPPEEGGYLHVFYWTEANGMVDLGTLPGGTMSLAGAASFDGSVIVGVADGTSGFQAFRWTAATGMVGVELSAAGDGCTFATVSANGKVIVGQTVDANEVTHSVRWTQRRGAEDLGTLSAGQFTRAHAVSADGSVIVGESLVGNNLVAFRWTRKTGIQAIQDLLVKGHKKGSPMSGWTQTSATAISADGGKIFGVGIDPSGNNQVWEADLPIGREIRFP